MTRIRTPHAFSLLNLLHLAQLLAKAPLGHVQGVLVQLRRHGPDAVSVTDQMLHQRRLLRQHTQLFRTHQLGSSLQADEAGSQHLSLIHI